jgi:hypothetical protein
VRLLNIKQKSFINQSPRIVAEIEGVAGRLPEGSGAAKLNKPN